MGRLVRALHDERKLIGTAAFILIASALAGYANAAEIEQFIRQSGMFETFEKIVRRIRENPDFFSTFGLIFFNNVRAAFTAMGLGLFFGVFPVLMLVTNGMMLGVILRQEASETGVHPLVLFAVKVLPHGVLELPAVVIAAAYGMRLGIAAARWLLGLAVPERRAASAAEWRGILERIPAAVAVVVVLLLIAAAIEAGLIIHWGIKGGGMGG